MPDLPSLSLSRRALKYFFNDGFLPVIIYGELRSGKSAYAIKVLIEILSYLRGFKITYDKLKQWFGFHPRDVVETWMNNTEKQPCYVWDDAGFWLFSMDWHDPMLIAIQKYLNVIGTDYGCLILTTPDPSWVLSKFSTLHGMIRVKIVHANGSDEDLESNPSDSMKFRRIATGYKPYKSPDFKKTGVNKVFRDEFSCKIPDDIYKDYKPNRDHFAHLAKEMMMNALSKKRKLSELEDFRLDRRLAGEITKAEKAKRKKKVAVNETLNDMPDVEDVVIRV